MQSIRALRVTALLSALALGTLVVAPAAQAQSAGQYTTLGDALYALGYQRTVWVDFENVQRRKNGTFTPSAPWTGDVFGDAEGNVARYEARYGAGSSHRKGTLVGERYSDYPVEVLIRHASNPLNIANAAAYVITTQDREDAEIVSPGGPVSVWDQYIMPLYHELAPEPVCAPFSPEVCD